MSHNFLEKKSDKNSKCHLLNILLSMLNCLFIMIVMTFLPSEAANIKSQLKCSLTCYKLEVVNSTWNEKENDALKFKENKR